MSENVSTEESGHRPFGELSLSPAMLANLGQLEYIAMTPIQAASLPLALAGNDLIAQAKTGSGKTAAFGLALLNRLNTSRFAVQAMVLCPTRELADQVTQEIRRLARFEENIKVLSLVGGSTLRNQANSLENGVHIVVGTPGRIMDHMERGYLKLDELNTLVLDEADRMLDMGFHDDIAFVAKRCPAQRQTLLFSATYPEGIAQLAKQFLRQPKEVKLLEQHEETKIRQRFFEVRDDERLDAVVRLLKHYRVPLSGQLAVVVGRSPILGKPMALMLLNANCTVTICHSRTQGLAQLVGQADIVVGAVGKPEFIRADWIRDGAVVVDAGYHPGGIGDIELAPLTARVAAYTPVPGGVGPMTINTLILQTVQAAERTLA